MSRRCPRCRPKTPQRRSLPRERSSARSSTWPPSSWKAKEADARTDIFAFGAVVYEMVTGKNAFEGTSQASLIGAIMNHQPSPVAEVQPVSPPLLDHVINACLAKNPEDRCQTAMDLMRELKWVVSMPVSDSVEDVSMEQVSASWRFLPWAVTALMLAIAAAASWNLWRVESGPGRAVARLVITLPDGQRFTGAGESFAPPVAVSQTGLRSSMQQPRGACPNCIAAAWMSSTPSRSPERRVQRRPCIRRMGAGLRFMRMAVCKESHWKAVLQ